MKSKKWANEVETLIIIKISALLHNMKRFAKSMLITLTIFAALVIMVFYLFMQHPKFGKTPKGQRLKLAQNSANFQSGKFRNLIEKSGMTEGSNIFVEVYKTFSSLFQIENRLTLSLQ
jgi:hypothetical protein